MSADQVNGKEAQPVSMASNLPGQMERLQRALHDSRADCQEKDKKIRDKENTIRELENELERESTRIYELEIEQNEKITENKELRLLLKKKDHEHKVLQETLHQAEEQTEKDAQSISNLRQTNKKQRDQLESAQKETKELVDGCDQLQKDLADAQQQAERAYHDGFEEARTLINNMPSIENPDPWGGSEASSACSSARMSTNPGSRQEKSHTSQTPSDNQSQTSHDPGLTLDQELADLTDGSDAQQNGYESPWAESQHIDAQHKNNNNHLSALEPEPYQADSRAMPLGKSELGPELATETAFNPDEAQSQAHPQPQQSPCTHKPDLSESEARREEPGVRMMLMSTSAWSWLSYWSYWWWWWWWWQASGANIFVVLLWYMWWTDGEWQWQQANQSPYSVSHQRCIVLGTDSRWLVQQSPGVSPASLLQ